MLQSSIGYDHRKVQILTPDEEAIITRWLGPRKSRKRRWSLSARGDAALGRGARAD